MARRRTLPTTGTVYLLHFSARISTRHTTQHYLGWAAVLDNRLAEHARGQGARLTAVAHERGITFDLVRTWEGDRNLERRLKNWHSHRALCPLCTRSRKRRSTEELPDESDTSPTDAG